MKKVLFLVLLCLALTGCGAKAPAAHGASENVSSTSVEETFPVGTLKKGLQTILVMGLDKYEHPEEKRGYINHMQSDFMAVVIADPETQTFRLLHLNRDTMTKIRRLGVFGDAAGSFEGQLALAHTFGSGGSDSCLNAVHVVSKFLGVPIEHYMSFTMDSVPILNDMAGGVTVTIKDDFSAVDETLKQGETVTLQGEQALTYVRTRKDVGDQTNVQRMERQREYLSQLYVQLMEKMASEDGFATKLTLRLGDSFQTDYSVNGISELSEQLSGYTMEPIVTIPGRSVKGEEFMEFYVDQEALQQIVNELFYDPVD